MTDLLIKTAYRDAGIWFQSTDWKWLSALEVYGILGLGQMVGLAMAGSRPPSELVRLFFNDIRRVEHWLYPAKRVRKLVRSGHIQVQRFPRHLLFFTLTERGHEALRNGGLARLSGFRHRISESMANHETAVAGVGLVLTEILGLEVLTARERVPWKGTGGRPPSDSRQVPDLWIVDDTEPKGVEIERGQKSKEEYRERWRAMRLSLPDNGLLLYLTVWPGGKRFIRELAQDYRADFVLVAELKEFMQGRGRCRFMGYQPGRSVVLRPLANPNTAAASQLVPPVGGPFAAPPQRSRVGALTPPLKRPGQSASPPASDVRPRPFPLSSPSPSPEGDTALTSGISRTTGGMDQ